LEGPKSSYGRIIDYVKENPEVVATFIESLGFELKDLKRFGDDI
jgi:hypothetical protein